MEQIDRTWHKNFEKYAKMIAKHKNYKGLFVEYEGDKPKWVVTGKSINGRKRLQWWNNQCQKYGVTIQKGCYAIITRLIHPTKKHICQCCGKELSIYYEYPNKNLLKKLTAYFNIKIEQTDYTIKDIIDKFCNKQNDLNFIARCFNLPDNLDKHSLINHIYEQYVDKMKSPLSPGVMSNCPDRFDGFHSDGLCCREKTDKGRHKSNMQTYVQDRRAYENWSDGDWNLANRLMGEFHKQPIMECPICGNTNKMTADHIGPISLGFCHSINFAPMCNSCNSSKNNRFTKKDVDTLKHLENKGEQVISWHSVYAWDYLKDKINNDEDAKNASSLMAKCHQNVLYVLSLIYKNTGKEFLVRYLHPEYSMYNYRFENLNLSDLSTLKIIKTPLDSKNKRKNKDRYIRISFESLEEFSAKNNRKNNFEINDDDKDLKNIIKQISKNNYTKADLLLKSLLKHISETIIKREW